MFHLFGDSFVNPQGVIESRNKKGFFVLFYILVIAVIMSIGTILSVVLYKGMDYSDRLEISNDIISQDVACTVVDGVLSCTEKDGYEKITNFGIAIYLIGDPNKYSEVKSDEISIVVYQDEVFLTLMGQKYYSVKINELPSSLSNIDFKDKESILTNLCDGIEEITLAYKWTFGIPAIIGVVISNIFVYLLIAFINYIFMLSFRQVMPGKQLFKIIVFAITPIMIAITLNSLLSYGVVLYFALFLGAFALSNRTYKKMALMISDAQKRMYAEELLKKMAEQKEKQDNQDSNDEKKN